VQLDCFGRLEVVPDEDAVGRHMDPRLVREVVEAVDQEAARDPERLRGLHDLGLVQTLVEERADEHRVRLLALQKRDDPGIRRDQPLERLERRVNRRTELLVHLDDRIRPVGVRLPRPGRGRPHQVVERSAAVVTCDGVLGREIPGVVACMTQECNRPGDLRIRHLVVDGPPHVGEAVDALRERPLQSTRKRDHHLVPSTVELDHDVSQAIQHPSPREEDDPLASGHRL
jgi:hypothetical protein